MLWGGVGYEQSEQGAVGRTWILGRRMSLPTSLAYALVRILIFGEVYSAGRASPLCADAAGLQL